MSANQLCELTGLNDRTVRKRLKTLLPVGEDGRAKFYNTVEALKLLYPTVSTQLAHENLLLERARRKKAEIELAKMNGELIPLNVVLKQVAKEYSIVRTQYRTLASKLAKALAITTDPAEVQSRLSDAIDDILTELSADADYRNKKLNRWNKTRSNEVDSSVTETDTEAEPSGVVG